MNIKKKLNYNMKWEDYFSLLYCLKCNNELKYTNESILKIYYSDITGELICSNCKTTYPLFQNIPIMFSDEKRVSILINKDLYKNNLNDVIKKMKMISSYSGNQLKQFQKKNQYFSDSISWEILFWELWKEEDKDKGFLDFNLKKINNFLQNDIEGGGRLKYFEKVILNSKNLLNEKNLLNIGAGRDFLLEKYLFLGYNVIEQDVILESLIYLKQRGASFCICCDARELPFKNNSFNISTSFATLHHIWPIEKPISELLRVTNGYIHFNEPNYFSLTRVAFILPNYFRQKLKNFYSGDISHSPYEDVINPYLIKKIVQKKNAIIKEFIFTKTSWILDNNNIIKNILRKLNILFAYVFPIFSSHFNAIIYKPLSKQKSNKNTFIMR